MGYIVRLDDEAITDHDRVGGKAKNLGVLTTGGFQVPAAFVVATDAYVRAIAANGAAEAIAELAPRFAYDDPELLEEQAAKIRALITEGPLPDDVREAVREAYEADGADGFVAVRSSGTAEDLEDASFAGQHDTYLDVRGLDEVLRAIRNCWASLWSTRAVAYRHRTGNDHAEARLAVVVQHMVESEASGVMFTANPLTGATDEIVVNAGWGLGEGIVSGILTPDQFTFAKRTLRVVEKVMGEKKVRVVRDPQTGIGTVTESTTAEQQSRFCLSDEEAGRLAELGRRVEAYYEGMPQDIEWAYTDGAFYLLQSRDVTGVEMTWDEDVDAWQTQPEDPEVVWSRGFADEFWTGAITPLFYSVRAREQTQGHIRISKEWGFDDLAQLRRHRYHKAEAYISADYQKTLVTKIVPKQFRAGQVGYLPAADREAAESWPFSLGSYLRMHARIMALAPKQGLVKWLDEVDNLLSDHVADAEGLSNEELAKLTDDELIKEIDRYCDYADYLMYAMWSGFFIHAANAMSLLGLMVQKWYRGTNEAVFTDLITGLPQRTTTVKENHAMWELANEIRSHGSLRERILACEPTELLSALRAHPDGAAAAEMYETMRREHGHRGHADRDFWFPRRLDDSTIDHQVLISLLRSESTADPLEAEERLVEKRLRATEDVIASMRELPFGNLRVEAFKALLGYVHRFLVARDDERHFMDRITYTKKRAFTEVSRRLVERGRFDNHEDFYFLSQAELYDVLKDRAPMRLIRAKIKGRRAAFDRMNRKEQVPPYFLKGNAEYIDGPDEQLDDSSGVLAGAGTSRGEITGTARVVRELKEIGRVQKGDILITNSTDPAWTPVFLVIQGLVLETGGMLAHGACLSREYNLPAVTIRDAISRIPDGATITVDGTNGLVRIHEEELVAVE